MRNSFKYRIYPTPEQESILVGWQGQLRFVWNQFLSLNIQEYSASKKFIFKIALSNMLPSMKAQYPWLNAPSQSYQQLAAQLDQSLKNCYRSGFGFPKFKRKHGPASGIKIPHQGYIKIGPKFIKIPKLGEVRWEKHRPLDGILKSITITKDVDQWFVSCSCEIADPEPINLHNVDLAKESESLDLGIKQFATMSLGIVYDMPNTKKKERQLRKLQKQASRKKKGSKNRAKANILVAKKYRTIRRIKEDFHHKASCQIANDNSFVFGEDLAVKNMMANHCLAKAIQDQGFSQFTTMLSYKLARKGGEFIKVDQFFPSSQLCSSCGNRQKMHLNLRTYNCPVCGLSLDRDYNAALNIKAEGLAILSRRAGTAQTEPISIGSTPDEDGTSSSIDTSNEENRISSSSCVSLTQEKSMGFVGEFALHLPEEPQI
jgi:putative transposase